MKIKSTPRGKPRDKASHVHSRNGYRHKSILYSGDDDNSSANRDKNIQLIRNTIWRKYKI
jgi:hypothetical protein